MKLYLSDLDGTLLNEAGRLSTYTVETLGQLMSKGMRFTVASGQTPFSALKKLSALPLCEPLILMNGAAIVSPGGELLWTLPMERTAMTRLASIEDAFALHGAVLWDEGGRTRVSFAAQYSALWERFFQRNEVVVPTDRDSSSANARPLALCAMYIDDTPQRLAAMATVLAADVAFAVDFYQDSADAACWCLQVRSSGASKGRAAVDLRRMTGAAHLVAFGDGKEDISLFAACQEGYAVKNADPALRNAANGVIGASHADGVARFLMTTEQ